MKRIITFMLLMLCASAVFSQGAEEHENQNIHSQSAEQHVRHFLSSYSLPGNSRVRKAQVKSMDVNERKSTIDLTLTGGADEMYYTDDIVDQMYRDIRSCLPESYRKYKLSITADGRPIEYLVPNALRRGKSEKSKLWKKEHDTEDERWVTNISRPYKIGKGLDGHHISLCQSHGRYYDASKGGWVWQRPRLFCTTEDLFSQTFVIPYIIPMLENAGAIVYTTRDHFWQNQEEIVDMDQDEDMKYFEVAMNEDEWETSPQPGFRHSQEVYTGHDTPFGKGTCRQIKSVKPSKRASEMALVQWIPDIPKSGRYPVYVSYQSFKNSAEDVVYEVHHAGGVSEVKVNQRMGGGTWVLLGEFDFLQGMNDNGKIVLSNICRRKGQIVSADAVRIGGGMGNIVRGGSLSGLPRWAEAAKYSAQWYGLPDSCYESISGDEYRSDIYSRPKSTNELGGGSVYIPNRDGRKVPIEVCMAFHTDAGFRTSNELIGPLSICTTDYNDGLLASGMDRHASRDLASLLYEGVNRDMKKYNFQVRGLWNRNYGESRAADVPSIIFEMLSHQNFADMRLGYDPQFKFDFCRSIYKSVLRYICSMHDKPYVVAPLPVTDFSVRLDEGRKEAVLSWSPVSDPLEPSARATSYVVYTRRGRYGFDNGQVVQGTTMRVPLQADIVYSFKVCALNEGGRSFPSEVLSAGLSPQGKGTALIVNGFTRLEGPAWYDTSSEQGFLLDKDPGVQYGSFAGFCGRQKVFTKSTAGSEAVDGLGYSGSELEGKVVMGNTFDYPCIHGEGMLAGGLSFASVSESAFQQMGNLRDYRAIDMIYGVQKVFNEESLSQLSGYVSDGGALLLSGANLLKSGSIGSRFGISGQGVVSGPCSLSNQYSQFDIYRELNEEMYSVPEPDVLTVPDGGMMVAEYTGIGAAGVRKGNVTVYGFPIESIKDQRMINTVIRDAFEAK